MSRVATILSAAPAVDVGSSGTSGSAEDALPLIPVLPGLLGALEGSHPAQGRLVLGPWGRCRQRSSYAVAGLVDGMLPTELTGTS
jgi:hypothetical protein